MSAPRFAAAAAAALALAAWGCSSAPEPTTDGDEEPLNVSWFDTEYARVREVPLAPGVDAVLGGGGNSLLVEGNGAALLVDSKFDVFPSPAAHRLEDLVEQHLAPLHLQVSTLVVTHYHYDHTFGDSLYPDALVYGGRGARAAMLRADPEHWASGVGLVSREVSAVTSLDVGGVRVEVHRSRRGHTATDVWVRVPEANVVALGDLMFNTYFPFFDETADGSSLVGTVAELRAIVAAYPDATFLPGHGPPCDTAAVADYADWMERLYVAAHHAVAEGLTEAEFVHGEDVSRWDDRRVLPSMHDGLLRWATARSTLRSAYRVVKARGE